MAVVTDLSGAHCHVTPWHHDHPCMQPQDWFPLPDWRELLANRGALLAVVAP
jgi:hypothetical protein